MNAPLILTLQLDEESQSFFNQKRKQYFPTERNFIDAHLTLFHHLPDTKDVLTGLELLCFQQKPFELQVTEPKNIGKGVAYKIESKDLISLHKKLQKEWLDLLTTQDRQGLWPHITIQNKVTPVEAEETLQQLKNKFIPYTVYAIGLTLWQYLNGPWQWYQFFPFLG